MYAYIQICMCIYEYTCIYTQMYICIYLYICCKNIRPISSVSRRRIFLQQHTPQSYKVCGWHTPLKKRNLTTLVASVSIRFLFGLPSVAVCGWHTLQKMSFFPYSVSCLCLYKVCGWVCPPHNVSCLCKVCGWVFQYVYIYIYIYIYMYLCVPLPWTWVFFWHKKKFFLTMYSSLVWCDVFMCVIGCIHICCSVLHCVSVCCSLGYCVAVCCNWLWTLRCIHMRNVSIYIYIYVYVYIYICIRIYMIHMHTYMHMYIHIYV